MFTKIVLGFVAFIALAACQTTLTPDGSPSTLRVSVKQANSLKWIVDSSQLGESENLGCGPGLRGDARSYSDWFAATYDRSPSWTAGPGQAAFFYDDAPFALTVVSENPDGVLRTYLGFSDFPAGRIDYPEGVLIQYSPDSALVSDRRDGGDGVANRSIQIVGDTADPRTGQILTAEFRMVGPLEWFEFEAHGMSSANPYPNVARKMVYFVPRRFCVPE